MAVYGVAALPAPGTSFTVTGQSVFGPLCNNCPVLKASCSSLPTVGLEFKAYASASVQKSLNRAKCVDLKALVVVHMLRKVFQDRRCNTFDRVRVPILSRFIEPRPATMSKESIPTPCVDSRSFLVQRAEASDRKAGEP